MILYCEDGAEYALKGPKKDYFELERVNPIMAKGVPVVVTIFVTLEHLDSMQKIER